MTTPAQKRARDRYAADHLTRIVVKLNDRTDADVLARLDRVGNKQGYIKALIRADIERNDHDGTSQ